MQHREITRLSSKGQIIIPKSIRAGRGWHRGTRLWVEETKEGVLLRAPMKFPETSLDQVAGCLPFKGKAKTLRQMELAIKKGVRQVCPPPK